MINDEAIRLRENAQALLQLLNNPLMAEKKEYHRKQIKLFVQS